MSHHSIAFALNSDLSISGYGPHMIIHYLSGGILSESESRSISCAINQALFSGSVTLVLAYNMFICIDLIITLRNPLIRGKTRMRYYHISGIILGIIQVVYNVIVNAQYSECYVSGVIFYQEL